MTYGITPHQVHHLVSAAPMSLSEKQVNGRLRCLGSTQHLKHRFGSGFEADMKLQPPSTAAATEVMQLLMAHGVANIIGDDIDRYSSLTFSVVV